MPAAWPAPGDGCRSGRLRWSCGAIARTTRSICARTCTTNAIAEVRRIHADYKPTIAYYDERARNPRNAITGVEFAEKLKKQQRKETA